MTEQTWVGFAISAGEWDVAAVFSGPDGEQLAAQWAAEGGGRIEAWPVITSRQDVVLAVSRMEDTPYARWTAQLLDRA